MGKAPGLPLASHFRPREYVEKRKHIKVPGEVPRPSFFRSQAMPTAHWQPPSEVLRTPQDAKCIGGEINAN